MKSTKEVTQGFDTNCSAFRLNGSNDVYLYEGLREVFSFVPETEYGETCRAFDARIQQSQQAYTHKDQLNAERPAFSLKHEVSLPAPPG